MCQIIYLKSGKELGSVQEFEDHFKVDSAPYLDPCYKEVATDCCLCQLDLEAFFKDTDFTFDIDTWYEEFEGTNN